MQAEEDIALLKEKACTRRLSIDTRVLILCDLGDAYVRAGNKDEAILRYLIISRFITRAAAHIQVQYHCRLAKVYRAYGMPDEFLREKIHVRAALGRL